MSRLGNRLNKLERASTAHNLMHTVLIGYTTDEKEAEKRQREAYGELLKQTGSSVKGIICYVQYYGSDSDFRWSLGKNKTPKDL